MRRSQSRQLVGQRWSKERWPTKESEESSNESESVSGEDDDIDRINLMDTRTLGDIGDLFSFCTEYINTRFVGVLLYMCLPQFGHP